MKIRSATFFMSRGAEKKVAKKPSCPYLRCLQKNKGQPPNQKDCPLFINRFFSVPWEIVPSGD